MFIGFGPKNSVFDFFDGFDFEEVLGLSAYAVDAMLGQQNILTNLYHWVSLSPSKSCGRVTSFMFVVK